MRKIPRLLFLLLLFPLLFACETDFEINGKWSDKPAIYGILDRSDSIHYIRINRTFLGEGNAYSFAAIKDSIFYSYPLDVRMECYNSSGNFVKEIILKDTLLEQQSSIFYSGMVPFYYFTDALTTGYTYRLKVLNPRTGNLSESSVLMLGGNIGADFNNSSFPNQFSFDTSSAVTIINWNTIQNGKLYEISFKFYYRELLPGATDTIEKTFNWKIGSNKASTLEGGDKLSLNFTKRTFYTIIASQIPVVEGSKRWLDKADLIFSIASDELSTYIDVNNNSSGLIQEKPIYTNITNGIGIFSAREKKIYSRPIYYKTIDFLQYLDETKNLNFQDEF